MEKLQLSINGKNVECPAGTSILNAATENGIKIPTLCHHPELKPFGACRICLVEDDTSGRLVASCVTPVAAGMNIRTDSSRIKNHRRNVIRLMIAEHPESCIVCGKGNRCELRRIAAELGVGETGLYPMPNFKPLEQANDFIVRDLSKCILCGKCIRADHELVVVGAIDYNHRGFDTRPATMREQPLEKSNCIFCGTCVSICPTGALAAKNHQWVGTPEETKEVICGFCGVGCVQRVGIAGARIVEINPAHRKGSVNGATLCVQGHFPHDFMKAERLNRPLIRKNGELVVVTWEEALDTVAAKLSRISKKEGSDKVAFVGSSAMTNEENYFFQKIARIIGTNHVDFGAAAYARFLRRIDEKTKDAFRVQPLSRLESADAVYIAGADPEINAPVASFYLKRAARKGVSLIFASEEPADLSRFASVNLEVSPQDQVNVMQSIKAAMTGKTTAQKTSVNDLNTAAALIKGRTVSVIIGESVLRQTGGRKTADILLDVFQATGKINSIFVLSDGCNRMGACDMGVVPDALPGRLPIGDEVARKQIEQTWETDIPKAPGLDFEDLLIAAGNGQVKAMYVMGDNPLTRSVLSSDVRDNLEKLEFLVIHHIHNADIAGLADVVLPGAAYYEKEGSFTNMEGRLQCFTPAVPPPDGARPDFEILTKLSENLGIKEPFDSIETVRKEISRLVTMYDLKKGRFRDWIK